MRLRLFPGGRRASERGGAAGTSALGCECPPASALGRRLLLDFAPKGTRTRRSGLPGASERHKKAWTTGVSPLKRGPSDFKPGNASALGSRFRGNDNRRRLIPKTNEQAFRQSLRSVARRGLQAFGRSEEHTSELQSLMRISYAVFCLKKKNITKQQHHR